MKIDYLYDSCETDIFYVHKLLCNIIISNMEELRKWEYPATVNNTLHTHFTPTPVALLLSD